MLKPLRDRILVKKDAREEKTEAGIVIPGTALNREARTGKVLAIGIGRRKKDKSFRPITDIKVGDTVFFLSGDLSGVKLKDLNGDEYLVLKEDEIAGVIE